jgi:cytochrome c oxidase subunit 2
MNITWILIFLVQAVTQVLLHYFSFKYRGKTENKALFFSDSNRLEIIWSGIPAVVLAVLIGYGLYSWVDIMFIDEDEDVIEIELYAQQFNWTARYAGADNVLGKANVRLIEGVNIVGVDLSDPNAQDDIVVKELHIPKGKKVHFKFRSQDVLHSAFFPHFRAQMNCVPGMVTEFRFTPNKTTAEMRKDPYVIKMMKEINDVRAKQNKEPIEFDFMLLCNKICGGSHYNMPMTIIVESEKDYTAWIAKQKVVKTLASK